jgi:hypothetical protein
MYSRGVDAKPPSNARPDSKPTRQRTPPEALPAEIVLAEIVLVDGSAVRPRHWRPAAKLDPIPAVDALDFTLTHCARRTSAAAHLEGRLTMQLTTPVRPAPDDEAELFRPHFDQGRWHWTYHNARGRLLARGAECADRSAAHLALLAAIADYCTCGEPADEEEEEEPTFEVD